KKKSEQSLRSVFRDFGDILEIADRFAGEVFARFVSGRKDSVSSDCACPASLSAGAGWTSHLELSNDVRAALRSPAAAYIQKMNRKDDASLQPAVCRACVIQPPARKPPAPPRVPKTTWKAKTSDLVFASDKWASVDSSIALKGPISFPLGLITPTTATSSSS